MRAAIRGIVVVCLSLLGWLPLSGLCAHPDATPDDKVLARIIADWHKRQERIGRIRYVLRGENITPKGSITDDKGQPRDPPSPPRDRVRNTDSELLIDLRHQRYRWEHDNDTDSFNGKATCRRTTSVFDGLTNMYADSPEEDPPPSYKNDFPRIDVRIHKNAGRGRPFGFFNNGMAPISFAHGLMAQGQLVAALGDKLDPAHFQVDRRAVHAGRPCVVLRFYFPGAKTKNGFVEYWVDVERDSAIIRYCHPDGNILREDYDVTYQPTPAGWLPLEWQVAVRGGSGRTVTNILRMRVEQYTLEPKVTPRDFTLPMQPGMIVEETDYGTTPFPQYLFVYSQLPRTFFQVDFNGEWVAFDPSQKKETPRIPLRYWLICAAVLGGCGLRYLLWRRGKRPQFSVETLMHSGRRRSPAGDRFKKK